MTIERLGVNGWTLENKTFYERDLISRAVPEFRYVGLGTKKPIPRRGGNSIERRRLERPAAATTPLTEGTPPTETQTTFTNVVATVVQYGAFNKMSDVALNQSIDDVLPEHISMWGEHMRDSLDRVARTILVAGTNVLYADSATSRGALTRGNVLDELEIRRMRRTLRRQNVRPISRIGGKYALITHPDSVDLDLMSDTTIQNVLQNAAARGTSNPYFTGDEFDYLGVKIMTTTNVSVVSGGGLSLAAAVHIFQSIMLGEDAYLESEFNWDTMEIIVKPVGSAGAADPLNQYGTSGWKAAYAAAIQDQTRIVRLEHSTSANQLP